MAKLTAREMGMPIHSACEEMDFAYDYFAWNLDNAEKYLAPEITHEDENEINEVHYKPLGVAAVMITASHNPPTDNGIKLFDDGVEYAREHLDDLGFDHVTLDLHGYQTGSVSPADEDDEPLVEDVFAQEYPEN